MILFVEMSPGCRGFDQGDGCPDLGTRCFSAGVTYCNYTRRVFGCFGFLVFVIDFIVLRVDRLGRSVMGASVTETEAVLVSGFLPRKVVACPRLSRLSCPTAWYTSFGMALKDPSNQSHRKPKSMPKQRLY